MSSSTNTASVDFTPEVELAHEQLAASVLVRKLMQDLRNDDARCLAELRVLTEIPAPPFKEQARARYMHERMRELGLKDAYIDEEGNVIGVRKGRGAGPRLVVSAHLDTVFPEGTDVRVTERDGVLYGPGIADNTRGLALLLSWLKVLEDNDVATVGDLIFVANVGEEGEGDLRGIKALFREIADIDGMIGTEPPGQLAGLPDEITVAGIGSHRYRVHFSGPGGHSFEAFGLPSAVHAMGRAIAAIADITVPAEPKTTFTVGVAGGGTSVNTIAPTASMDIDIRSGDAQSLQRAEQQILAAIDQAVSAENRRWDREQISARIELIGDRPAGHTDAASTIVQALVRSITGYGRPAPTLASHSADANVPMSLGIPAITVSNGGKSGKQHSIHEWFDPTDAWQDAQINLMGILNLVGVAAVSQPTLLRRPR